MLKVEKYLLRQFPDFIPESNIPEDRQLLLCCRKSESFQPSDWSSNSSDCKFIIVPEDVGNAKIHLWIMITCLMLAIFLIFTGIKVIQNTRNKNKKRESTSSFLTFSCPFRENQGKYGTG